MSKKNFNILSSSGGVLVFINTRISKHLPSFISRENDNIVLWYEENGEIINTINIPAIEHRKLLLNKNIKSMIVIVDSNNDKKILNSKEYILE